MSILMVASLGVAPSLRVSKTPVQRLHFEAIVSKFIVLMFSLSIQVTPNLQLFYAAESSRHKVNGWMYFVQQFIEFFIVVS